MGKIQWNPFTSVTIWGVILAVVGYFWNHLDPTQVPEGWRWILEPLGVLLAAYGIRRRTEEIARKVGLPPRGVTDPSPANPAQPLSRQGVTSTDRGNVAITGDGRTVDGKRAMGGG